MRNEPSVPAQRRGSLRRQLIAWNILALAVLLAILGLTIRYTVHSFLMASVDRELERFLRFIPPGPPNGGFRPPQDERGERFRGRFRGGGRDREDDRPFPFGMRGGFRPDRPPGRDFGRPAPWESNLYYGHHHFDLEGNSLVKSDTRPMWDPHGFALAVKGQKHFSTVVIDGQPLRVVSVPERRRANISSVVQLAYPLTDIQRAFAGTDRALLTLIPLGLLGAGLGGAFLTDRVLRRVRRTTQAAEQMSANDFSKRLPVIGNDEFSELADTFNGLLDRLDTAFHEQQRLLEQQRRFTADASHELKTPLTVIKGTASLGLSGTRDENAYRRLLCDIDTAADTMSHLVQDLLLLARSDGGQLGKNQILLPVREVLGRAVTGVPRNDAASLTLTVEDEALCVLGNEAELVRLFTNLLDNAVRHTPPEGTIRVSAWAEGTHIVVCVTDTGTGIAPEHLPHLGERFYRVDASRSRPDGGTGLGLSICKGIVEAHGGTMHIDSTPGIGTTIQVTLPTCRL